MQTELAGEGVQILGINKIGAESGNGATCDGRDIPWLQDRVDDDVWELWQVTYRDVLILDADNRLIAVYNLTANNLADAASYDALKMMLQTAAAP